MRVFDHPNLSNNWVCPICKINKDIPVILAGINGTQEDNIIEAEQFHLDCIELRYFKEQNIIAFKF